jgi:hypothetical protein
LGCFVIIAISSLSGHVLFEFVYPGSDEMSSHAYISRAESVGDSVGAMVGTIGGEVYTIEDEL